MKRILTAVLALPLLLLADDAGKALDDLKRQRDEIEKKILALKQAQPKREIQDYVLKDVNGKDAKLSELFGAKDVLIAVQNMGRACEVCGIYGDELNGALKHLTAESAFIVVSSDDAETNRKTAAEHGWSFGLYSGKDSAFSKDLGFVGEKGPMPGFSVLQRKDGKILVHAQANFFQGDHVSGVLGILWSLPQK